MPMHANSLANLTTPFSGPGDPRNGHSRSMGASYIEWCNRLEGETDKALETIRASDEEPRSKRLAAATLIRASMQEFAKNGRPYAADDLDRILDRTHGKALQRVEVKREETMDPALVKLELVKLLAAHPELRERLADALPAAAADNGDQDAPADPPGAPQGGLDAVE